MPYKQSLSRFAGKVTKDSFLRRKPLNLMLKAIKVNPRKKLTGCSRHKDSRFVRGR